MEWWIKKLREASTSTHTHAVLQSGQLTIIKVLNATHFSAERWGAIANITAH